MGWYVEAREEHSRDLVFRPEVFFLGRTDGEGIDRNIFGRTIRRCTIHALGKPHPAIQAICVNEVLTYDDGEVQDWRWMLSYASGGRYVVAEVQAGSGHVAEHRVDGDFQVSFRRTRGWMAQRHVTRYALLTDTVALEHTRVSLLGAPLLLFTAVRRRVASQPAVP
jgi:hypothetical protein